MVVRRWPMRTESGQVLVIPLAHDGLVIVQIHLRRAADHVEIDDLFGFGREIRADGAVLRRGGGADFFRGAQHLRGEHAEGGRAHETRAALEELAARFVADVILEERMRIEFGKADIRFLFVQDFVHVHQFVGDHGVGGEGGLVQCGVGLGFADGNQRLSVFRRRPGNGRANPSKRLR